jgi:hypothetical protein
VLKMSSDPNCWERSFSRQKCLRVKHFASSSSLLLLIWDEIGKESVEELGF